MQPSECLPPPLTPLLLYPVPPFPIPCSTPTCFLPVLSLRSGFLWKVARMDRPHSGLGTAATPLSTGSALCNKAGHQGRGFLGSQKRTCTLLQIRSSLHRTVQHRNNYQKTNLDPTPFLSPTQGQPNSPPDTIRPHLTNILVSSHSSLLLSFQVRTGQTLAPQPLRCK